MMTSEDRRAAAMEAAREMRGVRVPKECQAFYNAVLKAGDAYRHMRHFRYCEECGFLRPGHSDDCGVLFRPAFADAYGEEGGTSVALNITIPAGFVAAVAQMRDAVGRAVAGAVRTMEREFGPGWAEEVGRRIAEAKAAESAAATHDDGYDRVAWDAGEWEADRRPLPRRPDCGERGHAPEPGRPGERRARDACAAAPRPPAPPKH